MRRSGYILIAVGVLLFIGAGLLMRAANRNSRPALMQFKITGPAGMKVAEYRVSHDDPSVWGMGQGYDVPFTSAAKMATELHVHAMSYSTGEMRVEVFADGRSLGVAVASCPNQRIECGIRKGVLSRRFWAEISPNPPPTTGTK